MKIIVGLGNPGKKYEKTRHNIGFRTIDKIKDYLFKNNFQIDNFCLDKNLNAQISKVIINAEKIILVKPQTYMNNSGLSVKKIIDFYKINPENDLIIIYDDIDLPFSKIRTKGKSSGGHKGMQSIIDTLKSSNLKRVRIGILGKEKNKIKDTALYVLKSFEKEEEKEIENISIKAFDYLKKYFLKIK